MTAESPEPLSAHLRDRLVHQALGLLADEGVEHLTLRRLARRAGVSHSAPLRHFRSLSDLRAEVAAAGFEQLLEALENAAATLPGEASVRQRLRAACRAYICVATENAALFALMFRAEDLDPGNLRYVQSGIAAFDALVAHVRELQQRGWHVSQDTRLLAGSLWSAVHGFAALWSQRAFAGPIPGASLDAGIETMLALLVSPETGEGS